MTNLKMGLFCIVSLLTVTSCDFFADELKQDQQLAFYRHQAHRISDSITIVNKRLEAFKGIVEKASDDEFLITPRKKNKLLSEIYNIIGSEYYEARDIDNAIASTTMAIVLNTTSQHAHYNRACLYQKIGKDSLAIVDYTAAIMYDENYVDSYYNRGILYEKKTDFQLAVEDYTEAIDLNPQYLVDVYNNRGNVYHTMEFYDKALEDYNKAIALDSTLAITYCNRAETYIHLGEKEKAVEDYRKAATADSTNTLVVKRIEALKRKAREEKRAAKED